MEQAAHFCDVTPLFMEVRRLASEYKGVQLKEAFNDLASRTNLSSVNYHASNAFPRFNVEQAGSNVISIRFRTTPALATVTDYTSDQLEKLKGIIATIKGQAYKLDKATGSIAEVTELQKGTFNLCSLIIGVPFALELGCPETIEDRVKLPHFIQLKRRPAKVNGNSIIINGNACLTLTGYERKMEVHEGYLNLKEVAFAIGSIGKLIFHYSMPSIWEHNMARRARTPLP